MLSTLLEFDNRRSSDPSVRKVLQSAVANAQDRGGRDPMDLKVVASYVDEGPNHQTAGIPPVAAKSAQ